MATENDDPFAQIGQSGGADPFQQISAPAQQPAKEIGNFERFVLQNLFDTQPKRRQAYLKRLGYEMNPKDDNLVRPIGSQGSYAEIDPGFIDEFKKGWIKEQGKGVVAQFMAGRKNVIAEGMKDAGDVGFDTAVAGPLIVAGAEAGGGLGGMTGPLAPAAVPIGAILGGAVGNAGAEGMKKMAGDLLLDENVPLEKGPLVMQSVMSGMAPQLLKAGKSVLKSGYNAWLNARKDAIVNAAKQSGSGLTEDILDKAVKNPEMFSREAVDGANERMTSLYQNIFGIKDPLKLDAPERVTGGYFGEKMNVLNAQANSEIERLSKEQAANFKPEEILSPMQQMAMKLNNKFDRTADEDAALGYLKQKISEFKSKVTPEPIKPSGLVSVDGSLIQPQQQPMRQVNFKEAREFMTAIQNDMSAKDTAGNYLNPAGRVLAPAINGDKGVLAILNAKAGGLGSNLPQINAQRSRVLTAYNAAAETLTPTNITAAFVGNDTVKKELIKGAVGEMDQILGSNLTKEIEDGSMQRLVENLYKNPKGFGSGPSNAQRTNEMIKGGIKGMGVGMAAGAPLGPVGMAVGGAAGATAGAVRGAQFASEMANPESALKQLGILSGKIASSEADLALPQKLGIPAQLGAQEAGRSAGEFLVPGKPDAQPEKDVDPFSEF